MTIETSQGGAKLTLLGKKIDDSSRHVTRDRTWRGLLNAGWRKAVLGNDRENSRHWGRQKASQ